MAVVLRSLSLSLSIPQASPRYSGQQENEEFVNVTSVLNASINECINSLSPGLKQALFMSKGHLQVPGGADNSI